MYGSARLGQSAFEPRNDSERALVAHAVRSAASGDCDGRTLMKQGFLSGIAAVAIALALGVPNPAKAQSIGLPECNEATLWTVAETTVIDLFGTLRLFYQCVPEGWQLIGASYCSVDGGCSSD